MLSFDYTMELDFGCTAGGAAGRGESSPRVQARDHAFTLRCLPQELVCQHVIKSRIRLEPQTDLTYQVDAFGNRYCYGVIHEPHSVFRVQVTGSAEPLPGRHEPADPSAQILYRAQTGSTAPGPSIRALFQTVMPRGENLCKGREDTVREALRLRDGVHDYMTYTPDATMYDTSAEKAAAGRKGVCQDYAHIMLSLCRLAGISCRYTAGLLVGEGRSHAWVEICDHGTWIPMDPTNPDIGWQDQIIFSHGRDAEDCKINRGTFMGPSAQLQLVSASVRKEPL